MFSDLGALWRPENTCLITQNMVSCFAGSPPAFAHRKKICIKLCHLRPQGCAKAYNEIPHCDSDVYSDSDWSKRFGDFQNIRLNTYLQLCGIAEQGQHPIGWPIFWCHFSEMNINVLTKSVMWSPIQSFSSVNSENYFYTFTEESEKHNGI